MSSDLKNSEDSLDKIMKLQKTFEELKYFDYRELIEQYEETINAIEDLIQMKQDVIETEKIRVEKRKKINVERNQTN